MPVADRRRSAVLDINEQMQAEMTGPLGWAAVMIRMPKVHKMVNRIPHEHLDLTSFAASISPVSSKATPSISLASAFVGCCSRMRRMKRRARS